MDDPRLNQIESSKGDQQIDLDTFLVKEYYAQTGRPVMILDRSGGIVLANMAVEQTLNLPPKEEWHETWWIDLLSPSDESQLRTAFVQALGGEVVRGTINPSPNGRTLAYEMVSLRDDAGEVHAVAVSLNDITEQLEGRRLSEAINVLHEIMGSTLDLDTVLQGATDLSRTTMSATSVAVLMKEKRRWRVSYVSGEAVKAGLEISETEAEQAFPPLRTRDASFVEDVMTAKGLDHGFLASRRIRSALFVPLMQRNRIIGLMIVNYDRLREFSPIELDYARKLGAAVSLTMDNLLVHEEEKRQRRLLQQVIESSPAAIGLITYPQLKISLINKSFEKMVHGELDLRKIAASMPPGVPESVFRVLEEVHRTGEMYIEKEVPVHLSSGQELYWNIHVIGMDRENDGSLLVVATDVTAQVEDRKRIEDLVRLIDDEKARLEAVLETLPVGVLMVDPSGKGMISNEAFRSFFDLSIPSIWTDLLRMEGRWSVTGLPLKAEDWPIFKALHGERVSGAMIDIRRKDGDIRTVLVSAIPVSGRDEPIGAVLVFSDITERRHTEQEVLESRSRMELYLDLLTHDVNNLNTGARGYLELLLKKGGLDDRAVHYVVSSLTQMGDIARLVENVRKLQRAEDETLNRCAIDVNELINDLVATHLKDPSGQARISIRLGEQALVLGNALLRDVFDNLVGNAIKHAGGPVDIEIVIGRYVMGDKEFVRVDVTDTGPGIPDDVKKILFNRMQRGRTVASGHGLGLYLARTILEMFEGRIWADDRVPGDHAKGARFVVLMPAADATQL